jgi:aryl-alcohol dehydrogenase-like predicted oxidoreductase
LAGDAEVLASANWDVIEGLQKFAAQRDISMLDVAIGGLAAQPGVSTIIVGATKPEQVLANARAAAWEPAAVDLVELDGITGAARRS